MSTSVEFDAVSVCIPSDKVESPVVKSSVESAPTGERSTLLRDSTLPLSQSLKLSATYILTSILFFIAVRYSRSHHDSYDSAFLVLLIEVTKLTVSCVLKYLEDGEVLVHTIFVSRKRRSIWRRSLIYAVPSLLYAVYNNLTFHNLSLFDAGTYQVFMQTRILFTGMLFTVLLKQPLTLRKWLSLVVLMIGVAAKYFSVSSIVLDGNVWVMISQAFLSSLAGVYNEYAFKKHSQLSIHHQNFFMYLFAIVFNVGIGLLVNPTYYMNLDPATLLRPIFIPIVLLGAATGLSAAFILKFINVIVKAFASAVEVLLTAVVAAIVLGEALGLQDLVATVLVMTSVYMYYSNS